MVGRCAAVLRIGENLTVGNLPMARMPRGAFTMPGIVGAGSTPVPGSFAQIPTAVRSLRGLIVC